MHQDTKVFLTNTLHLTFLRGISRITPLLYTPYLIHKLGLTTMGTLEFAKAISFYFSTFVSYGFRYSATKQISLYKEEKKLVGQLISSVYILKFIGLGISFLIILGLIQWVPAVRQDKLYLLTFFPVVIASTLFPAFVFQALEKMQWLTILNVVTKALFIIGIFMLVHEPSDALWLPIILAFMDLLRLLVSLYWIYAKLQIPLALPNRSMMVAQLKEGVHIFFPELATMFYTRVPAIFLRLFIGSTAVGIYAIGDRCIRTTVGMIDPFIQALYPLAYKQLVQDRQAGLGFIVRVSLVSISILAMIGMVYWYFADDIITIFAGKSLPEAVCVLKLHAFLPCLVVLANIIGIGVLLPLKSGSRYTMSMLLAGTVCAALHFVLVPKFQTQGAAWAILIAEAMAAWMMLWWVYKNVSKQSIK